MVWQVDLKGKTIVVTGGNRGIGLAISEQVAQAGAHVAIIYRSSKDAPEVAKKLAEKYDVHVEAYQVDVADQQAITELFKKIYFDVGPIGGVVCNAGINAKKDALDLTKEDFDQNFGPNVWGVFTCAQAAARLWKEHDYRNGRIVFVSSVSGTIANKGVQQAFYNPTKAAVISLAKTLAMEWASQGTLVNCLSPGYVLTDMNASLRDNAEEQKEIAAQTMVNRISTPEEQAGTVVFLLSDYATYITGTQVVVDGGLHAW
ncbi:uncharacterized protein I303_102759 [Kwoniella dejecticola CBS 10117]|uniref:Ketoreductase domain-containing protein n=1 Tax=Kwoniella dejecticola CBS 10117 TaxID=1296121 RepID=A0A1A6A9M7_9TREE|nr:uncharacterized protein I303_02773 [Kwoniella dejecticola CBS 10117]OBR86759.1 hypothetical protein I303_02773 [Kwoniella dejecticola CBS 10117]